VGDVDGMEFVGGHPAIDYVNTLGGLPTDPDDEHLFGYPDLLTWLGRAALLQPQTAERLRAAAEARPPEAAAVHYDALDLRGALDRILRDHLTGTVSASGDREIIRMAYADAVANATLADVAGVYRLVWPDSDPALRYPLWRLADAAFTLLRDVPLDRLQRCDHCRWLYLDRSRNHSRRWCSMNSCGATMKMRRYRATRRAPAVGDP
jgi:predicted RNA-binding Zn ribbon-like protein